MGGDFIKKCAWCKKIILESSNKDLEEQEDDSNILSHGICSDCSKKLLKLKSYPQTIINEYKIPVLVINREVYVESANIEAKELFDFDIKKIKHKICGDVINCIHSELIEGCGSTEFCPSCSIRNLIEKTFETGEPEKGCIAEQKIKTKNGIKLMKLLISTELFGNNILLEINKILDIKDYQE